MFDKPVNSLKVFCLNLISFAFFYFCHISWKSPPIKKCQKFSSFQTHFINFPEQLDQFFLVFANFIIYSIKALSIVGLDLACEFLIRLEIYWGETRFAMHSFTNAFESCRVLILPLIFTTLFKSFNWSSLYRLRKYLKSLLVVQNFKIAFNSVGAIVSTLWNMDSLEKGCFRLNVFVHLSLWIYDGMKKN